MKTNKVINGMKVIAKGVFAQGLVDGTVYTLMAETPWGKVETFNFVTASGKVAARFDVYAIKRFLAMGQRGDNNGLTLPRSLLLPMCTVANPK